MASARKKLILKKPPSDGDLFPRGAAPTATPRVKRRTGEVLFTPSSKRPRPTRAPVPTPTESTLPVTRHGLTLSYSHLSPGATVLALVTRADQHAVIFALPSGLRAVAPPHDLLVEPVTRSVTRPLARSSPDSDSESDGSTAGSDSDSETDDGAPVLLCEALSVGQIVRAAVVSAAQDDAGRRIVTLSLKPDLVNAGLSAARVLKKGAPIYAAVRSVEDHGYILSFGAGVPHTGFLPFAETDGVLRPGFPVEVVVDRDVVKKKGKKRVVAPVVVNVSAKRERMICAKVEAADGISYHEMQAGMLVPARVVKEGPGGVALSAFAVFKVSVDASHVPRRRGGTWDVEIGKQVSARIVFVDPSQKRIVASLLPSLVEELRPRSVPEQWRIGTFMKSLKVERVKPGFGLILSFISPEIAGENTDDAMVDDGSERKEQGDEDASHLSTDDPAKLNVPVLAHISRVSDSKDVKLESKFYAGMIYTDGARVTSVSRFDGWVNVDLRRSILSRKALSVEEIQVGALYDCKIISHTTLGSLSVAIEGDSHLLGIVKSAHISDAPISTKRLAMHENLRIGATLRCRALHITLQRGKTYLSAKKSIVSPKYPLLTSFEQAEKAARHNRNGATEESDTTATIFTGSIHRVLDSGCVVVSFCGDLNALAPVRELCIDSKKSESQKLSEITSLYPVGQTVHVRITGVDTMRRRITVSMDLKIGSELSYASKFPLASIVDGHITSADEQAKHFVVSVEVPLERKKKKSKDVGVDEEMKDKVATSKRERLDCYLPFGHVADVPAVSDQLVKKILEVIGKQSESQNSASLPLKGLMVLSIRDGILILTLKPSLIDAAKQGLLPKSVDDVKRLDAASKAKKEKHIFLRGYVKALLPAGVIIGFLGDAVGFTRISRIADQFVSDPARVLQINQSVSAIVENIDEDKNRFSLSLRTTDVGFNGLKSDTLSLFGLLKEWQCLLQMDDTEKNFVIGSIENANFYAEHPFGRAYKLKSGSTSAIGVALDVKESNMGPVNKNPLGDLAEVKSKSAKKRKSKKRSKTSDESEEEPVRILDIDPFSGVVDLSRDEDVIAGGRRKSILEVGTTFSATVLLVKGAYLILSVARSKTRSAIAFALAPAVSDSLSIAPGTSVQCIILDKTKADTRRNLVLVDWISYRSKQKPNSRVPTDTKGLGSNETVSFLLQTTEENENLVIGKSVAGKISRTFPLHSFVAIAHGIVGHIHKTNTSFLTQEELQNIPLGIVPSAVCSRFVLPEEGSRINSAYVCGIRRHVSESEESNPMVVELSLVKEQTKTQQLSEGSTFIGFITHLSSRFSSPESQKGKNRCYSYTRVAVNANTVINCADVNCLFPDGQVELNVGTAVMCMVTAVEEKEDGRIWGTMSENGKSSDGFFFAIVQAKIPGVGIRVEIPWFARESTFKSKARGTVAFCDMSSNFNEVSEKMKNLKEGDVVRVRKVNSEVSSSEGDPSVWLSMRDHETEAVMDPLVTRGTVSSLNEGAKVRGFVRAVSKVGCFVTIGRNVSAQVLLCDLADNYVANPEKEFPVGMLVEGVIGKTKKTKNGTQVSLVLRKRRRKQLKEAVVVTNLAEGTKVKGTVKRVEPYGALLELGKGVTALLHKSEADQDRFVNPEEEWSIGQELHVIVIKSDDKGIKVGTKRCYFEAAGLEEDEINSLMDANEKSREASGQTQQDIEMVPIDPEKENSERENDESDDGDSVMESDEENVIEEDNAESTAIRNATTKQQVAPLQIGQSFNFGTEGDEQKVNDAKEESAEEEDSENEEESPHVQAKRSSRDKRDKKRQKEAAENAIRLREEALANDPDSPETAEDFERLLVGEPNSAVLWIRYMAFCLSLSQVDKARAVAERALETISLNEETDRANVWIAYINLEARFGASNSTSTDVGDALGLRRDAAVFRVFDRGCGRVTDVESFYLQVAAAVRSISPELADGILHRASKRFKRSIEVWIAVGLSQFSSSNITAARRTLEKALRSLEKNKHVPVISKFAQFEYKYGTAERGRTVFESLVGNFPKKLDLWNIYLDMETAQCRNATAEDRKEAVVSTRNLFERSTTLDLSSKKMKFLFKKWLSFEKEFGDQEERGAVKDKARDYVQRSTGFTS